MQMLYVALFNTSIPLPYIRVKINWEYIVVKLQCIVIKDYTLHSFCTQLLQNVA